MNKKWMALALAAALAAGTIGAVTGCAGNKPRGAGASRRRQPAAESARAEYLVGVSEFSTEGAIVLDARAPEAYAAGHIPGAINAPWQTFCDMAGKPGEADWGTLLAAADLAKKLGELGIDGSAPVIVYGDPTGWGEDGRVVWTLRTAGITDSRMLDGGFPAWTAAGNTGVKDEVKPTAVTAPALAALDDSLDITTDELKAGLGTIKVVDTRSAKEYDGATDFGEARGGRIPGAVNMPYPDVFNADGTVKSDAELEAMFAEAGLTDKDADIVFYCTKGIRSGHLSMLARMLGYAAARNYDASYYTWAGNAELEVEK